MSSTPNLRIACGRVAVIGETEVIAGAVKTPCRECEALVWLSPSSHDIMLRGVALPTCFECLTTMMQEKGMTFDMQALTPEQQEEVRRHRADHPPEDPSS